MPRWNLIRQFPKFALALGIILASVVVLVVWQMNRGAKQPVTVAPAPALKEDISDKLALIESKPFHLLLADNDLYDLDDGTRIFKDWLKEGMPVKLFFDARSGKFLALYARGFVRYAPDGTTGGTMLQKFKPVFSDDYKWMLFARDKDIWKADIDWQAFKTTNERKITAIEQFNDPFFADNIMVGTDKTLLVRNAGKILRVNLENGDVKPVRVPLGDIGKRRSPDGKSVVGLQNGQFYCYDVDSEEVKTVAVGRGAINDYQWLGNDRCAAIAAGKTVVLYDRTKNILSEITALSSHCTDIGGPSPEGTFVFSGGRGGGFVVDLEKKRALQVVGGAGVTWISANTFAFSREVHDSSLRGVWKQKVGEKEQRIYPVPFVAFSGDSVERVKKLGVVVALTGKGLLKISGEGEAGLIPTDKTPHSVLSIEEWPAH